MRTKTKGFTLIETLVAVTILAVAIVAPMSLTTQSLSAAYYARDQMIAFHLAQEAIETIRAVRDENILGGEADLLAGIPAGGTPFIVDSRDNEITVCDQGSPAQCPAMRIPESINDPIFYAYRDVDSTDDIYVTPLGWVDTRFRRTIQAELLTGSIDEIKITVTVSWQTGSYQQRNVTMRTNMYRWIDSLGG